MTKLRDFVTFNQIIKKIKLVEKEKNRRKF